MISSLYLLICIFLQCPFPYCFSSICFYYSNPCVFFFLIYHIFLCAFLSALNSVYCIKKKNYPFFILTYLKHLFFLKSPYVEFDFPFSVIFAHHIFLQTSNNLNKSSLSLSLEFKNLRHRSSSFDVSIPII